MLVRQLPAGSATHISTQGLRAAWTPGEYLLANVADSLAAANWQRGGGRGKKPKPVRRPADQAGVEQLGGGSSMSIDEFEARWQARHGEVT